jgi:TolB protein
MAIGIGAVVALAAAVGGAALTRQGLIVFVSDLPTYPLPDNLGTYQQFSIGVDGRNRREIHPAPHWVWSRDRVSLLFARETAGAVEVWQQRADATGRHRIAVLADAGPVVDIGLSPNGRQLFVAARSLWVLGATGSAPHVAYEPAAGVGLSQVRWTGNARLTLVADGLWLAAADGSRPIRLFQATVHDYVAAPDGGAAVVRNDRTWLARSDADPVEVTRDELSDVEWGPRGDAVAIESISDAACRTSGSSYKCAEWYVTVLDRGGKELSAFNDGRDLAWSPDGTRVAFESGLFALDPESGTIEVAARDGTAETTVSRRLKKSSDSCWRDPAWVGDLRVSFVESGCDPDQYETGSRTVVVDVATAKLVGSTSGSDAVPSPDGRRIAYLAPTQNGSAVFVAARDGTRRRRISPTNRDVDEVVWSPDGRFLFFTLGDTASEHGQQIYAAPEGGGPTRQVTHEPERSFEYGLSFADRGRRLVYWSNLDSVYGQALWLMRPDGTGVRRLTPSRTAKNNWAPAWSPDGNRIAFTHARGQGSEIDVIDADGRNLHRLVGRRGGKDASPSWSPDGTHLAFVREENGSLYLAVADADGGDVHLLKTAPSVYGRPVWAPDGTEILYVSGDELTSVSRDGKRIRTALHLSCDAPPCTQIGSFAFSPDGSRLVVSCAYCDRSTAEGVWTMRPDGSERRLTVAIPATRVSWSPDGQTILFAGKCRPAPPAGATPVEGICRIGVDGSNLRLLTPWPLWSGDASWG